MFASINSRRLKVQTGAAARIAVTVLAVLALAGFILVVLKQRTPAPPVAPTVPERLRSELEFRDGMLLLASGAPFTGFVVDRYDGGELKSRSVVSNGLLEGLSQGWYSNGVLQVTEVFQRGVSHGLRTKFHPNATKLSEAPIVNGQVNGTFRRWYDNGQLAEQVALSNGVPHGESLAFHSDGSPKARVRMEHGKVVDQVFFPPVEASGGADSSRNGD